MRKMMILVVPVALCMSLLALAAEKKGEIHHLRGEVTSVDAAAKTFTIKETLKGGHTKEVAFTDDARTKVMIQGKMAKLDEIKVGDSVKVSFVKKGTSKHARTVTVVGAPVTKS